MIGPINIILLNSCCRTGVELEIMLSFKKPAVWAHQAMMTCFSRLLNAFTFIEINAFVTIAFILFLHECNCSKQRFIVIVLEILYGHSK